MSRVISVLSGKGGVGKTTVVANLAASLTYDFKRNVILLDGNITTSHLGLHFGLYNDLPVTLREVLEKNVPPMHATFIHPTGVRIIPTPLNGKITKFSKFDKVVNQLKNDYEIVLIDSPPGLGRELLTELKTSEQAIVVATPDLPSITDALKTIDLLRKLKKDFLGLVLNRVRNERYELTKNEIESTCNCNIVSVIPEDPKVPESIAKGVPVCLYDGKSKAAVQLKKLAAHLVGEEYVAPGLLDRIINFFRSRKLEIIPKKETYPEETTKVEIKPKKTEKAKEVVDIEKLKTELRQEIRQDLEGEVERLRKKLSDEIIEAISKAKKLIEPK
jgi:septum site-determining protein MinD